MSDQKTIWNGVHAKHDSSEWHGPNEFARSVAEQLASDTTLLELGCGNGGDAAFFAEHGIAVTATDFSDVVVAKNTARNGSRLTNLTFQVVDIAERLPFADVSFDAVYAHLTLHYYNEPKTAEVFAEIARVLRPGSMLYFACKSDKDPLYGQGTEIEPGVFDLNGKIRHFFSLDYTRRLLGDLFEPVKLEAAEGVYYGEPSAFIHCWARKK